MSRIQALSAYRNALRATRIAFEGELSLFFLSGIPITNKNIGDVALLNASREQIRQGFHKPDLKKTDEKRIKELNDIAKFLVSNIVQGKKNESGKYKLNIHEGTELGDNESVKKAKQQLQAQGNGCCGGGMGLVN